MNDNTLDPDNVRTEYNALIAFHNSVVTYRFTLLGFFAAAVAFIAKAKQETPEAILLLFLTIGLYIVERRNRILYTQMAERAIEIERKHWKLNRSNDKSDDKPDTGLPLFCMLRMDLLPADLINELSDDQKKDYKRRRSFWMRMLSHSRGLDIVYLSVMLYSIWSLIRNGNLTLQENAMDPITALLSFAIIIVGFNLIRTGAIKKTGAIDNEDLRWPKILVLIGSVLILGAAVLITVTFRASRNLKTDNPQQIQQQGQSSQPTTASRVGLSSSSSGSVRVFPSKHAK
jgi:hypothetical protein